MASPLSHPFLKFPMDEKALEELAKNERDYLLLHGKMTFIDLLGYSAHIFFAYLSTTLFV